MGTLIVIGITIAKNKEKDLLFTSNHLNSKDIEGSKLTFTHLKFDSRDLPYTYLCENERLFNLKC